jgi:hypothetical protein
MITNEHPERELTYQPRLHLPRPPAAAGRARQVVVIDKRVPPASISLTTGGHGGAGGHTGRLFGPGGAGGSAKMATAETVGGTAGLLLGENPMAGLL